jgi:hypothetical protein
MIANLEDALLPALQLALDRRPPSETPLLARDYYRQYGGLIVGGKRIIYVNGFHRWFLARSGRNADAWTRWRTIAVRVCDGGLEYFGAEYDPDTRQVDAIEFNGSA